MASAKKEGKKRHNPVESICRKIRAIQKREALSNPVQQIIRYQSSSHNSLQTKTKKAFGEVLRRVTTIHLPVPDTPFSDPLVSPPEAVSPGLAASPHPSPPEAAEFSVDLTSSGNSPRWRAQIDDSTASLMSQSSPGEGLPSKGADSDCNDKAFSTLTLGFDSCSGEECPVFSPCDLVVRKLSLNEDALAGLELAMKTSLASTYKRSACFCLQSAEMKGGKTEGGPEDVACHAYSTCENELLSSVFHACDTRHRGTVCVGQIIDYLKQITSQDSEDSALEELWTMLDPGQTDSCVDLDTFQAIGKEWMTRRREGARNQSIGSSEDSVFEPQDGERSATRSTNITDAPLCFEAWRGALSERVFTMPDLITYTADLYLNKQRLEEENSRCKLALDTLEEANRRLAEDCTELRLQIKSAQKATRRTSVLQEELEELRAGMNAAEEHKTLTVAQNKQLEAENRALLLQIRILQEESIKNIKDIDSLEKKIEELSETEKEHKMRLHIYENMLLSKDASLQKKDLSIEELKSTVIEYRSVIENLRGDKNKLVHELQHFQHELIVNGIQLNVRGYGNNTGSEEESSLYYELALARTAEYEEVSGIGAFVDYSLQRVTSPEISVKEKCVKPLTKQPGHKPHRSKETRSQTPLALKSRLQFATLLDALNLDSLTNTLRLESTLLSCVENPVHALCERSHKREIGDGALDVTGGPKCPRPTGGSPPGPELPAGVRMSDGLSVGDNGAGRLFSESPSQLRECLTLPSPGHTSSSDSTVTSSDSGSEILHMASGDLDCTSLCEKEEETKPAPTVTGPGPAQETIACQDSMNGNKAAPHREAGEELQTIDGHRKDCAARETEVSTLPVASVRLANFQQGDSPSANEKEVEAEFLRLSLGLKCDWFTLEKRVKLEERSRDLAEENLKKEVTNCLKLLESLTPLCEDDNQAQEIIKKLEKSIMFLSQCSTRVASRAEMLGAINQESRVSKAVEVMIQHVENLKRMYAKEHAELEELKQALLQNERSFLPLDDGDDCQIKKRSSSLNSKPSSLRRVTIASLPRNLGNVAMVSGMENSDRFSRRSSSWRTLGTKQSEHRPSLQRFISTYSWADAEDGKCELKTKDESEPRGEAVVDQTRKPSLSDKKNSLSQWEASSVYGTVVSWAASLQASFRTVNKPLWLSVAFIVLFAALMSFLTGRFFQKSVEAAPIQEGDSWMSLEHILWPFTRLRHNGPPPL